MKMVIKYYGRVSVADMYDIAGIKAPYYTATKYGWTSVDTGEVIGCQDGYFIRLPKPEEIK